MPLTESPAPTSQRKSSRTPKPFKSSLVESEDEHKPGEKKGGSKRGKDDIFSEDDSMSKKIKGDRKDKTVATPGALKSVKTDPDAAETDCCVICEEKIKRTGVKGNTGLRL